jgi:hypothetical protein
MRRLTVSIASALLLAAGPLYAQQMALKGSKTQCPPGEPDSLQISWTAPCDSGTWLFDTEAGCRMWDWHPEPEDKVVWKGACKGSLPDGPGEAQWTEHGRPIDRFTGTYRDGKREGEGHYVWNDTVRFDGKYANDIPQGYGVAQIEGERLAGEWKNGCLSVGGKIAAIGVPRASCGGKVDPSIANRR